MRLYYKPRQNFSRFIESRITDRRFLKPQTPKHLCPPSVQNGMNGCSGDGRVRQQAQASSVAGVVIGPLNVKRYQWL
jgi:hypothetical protein